MKRRDEKGGAERNNWIHSHIIFYISTHSNIGFITFRDFIHIPISVKLTETATVDIPTTTFISTKRNETKWNKAYCCECKCECEWDEFFLYGIILSKLQMWKIWIENIWQRKAIGRLYDGVVYSSARCCCCLSVCLSVLKSKSKWTFYQHIWSS